jgi:uncharacterized membrane protein
MLLAPAKRSTILAFVAAVTMLGAVLRLWQLDAQSLWLDEAFTARIAPLDVTGIINAIRSDLDTPPLHPLLVHAFLLLGSSDFVLRLPSALAGILCIPLMYAVARRLLGTLTGLLAASMMALSPFAIYYSQEARMYALLLLFTLLAWYCLLRALSPISPCDIDHQENPQGKTANAAEARGWRGSSARRWWLGFTLASALGIYTHFFGFLLLGLLVIYAGVRLTVQWLTGRRTDALRNAGYLALSLLAVFILYLPWLPVLFSFMRENYSANPYGQRWQANLRLSVVTNVITLMLGGFMAHPVVRWVTRALFAIGLLSMLRRRPLGALFVAMSVSLPFALIMILNPGHFVAERYFIFMLPMLILGMAEGLCALIAIAWALVARCGRRAQTIAQALTPGAALAAFLVIILLSASGLERYYSEPARPAWRPLARYVARAASPDDLIVVATFPFWDKEPLQHYMKTNHRQRVVYAAEETNLKRILANERKPAWWVLYSPTTRRFGRAMSRSLAGFTVVPFDYLALVHRNAETADGVSDGVAVLTSFMSSARPVYPGDVQRVIKGLESSGGEIEKPGLPPVPTTVK